MASFLKTFFKSKTGSVLGIDLGTSAIKVVQLKKKGGKPVLETYGSLSLARYANNEIGEAAKLPEAKMAEALLHILKEAETSTNIAGIAIPFQASLMSVVTMPTSDKAELEKMVPIEARKYIPVPISEVSLDWMMIPSDKPTPRPGEKQKEDVEKSETDILLVAIHNKEIANLQALVKKAELEARFYEIEIFSAIRAIIEDNKVSSLVFDMGSLNTKLYFVKKGAIHASHTLNKGSQDLTKAIASSFELSFAEAEKMKRGHGIISTESTQQMTQAVKTSLGPIFADTLNAIENFESKYGETVENVYLVGGGSTIRGLREVAEKQLNKKVITGDAFQKIETPQELDEVLHETGPEFAVAAGLALRALESLE